MILEETIKEMIVEFFDQKMQSIGMITAQNPQEVPHAEDFNNSVNDLLLKDLRSMGFEPFSTFYYGENGYLIPNISKRELMDLGKKYNQKAVIWGSKVPEDRNGMTFHWQYLEDGKIRGEKISHHPFVCPRFP